MNVKANMPDGSIDSKESRVICGGLLSERLGIFGLSSWDGCRLCGIKLFTFMPDSTAKRHALEATGTFNPRFAAVRHDLFHEGGFFDPRDLLQLKYETLRAIERDGCPIARAAGEFGLSRPTIYQAQGQLRTEGLQGLLPHKRGPHAAHKLTAEVTGYLKEQKSAEPELVAAELARRVRGRFKIQLHPRTIEKALGGRGRKRGRQTSP